MTQEMRLLLEKMKSGREKVAPTDRVLLIREAQGFITSASRKLGIPRFTTHTLRHLFGTARLEAALLLKIYSHVRKEHEAEMIRRVRFAPVPA